MASAVIVSAVRTAVAASRNGPLADTPAEVLAATVIREAVARAGFAPERVDDIVMAEALYGGGAVARYAAVELGMMQAGGMALNRYCAGGLSAIGVAAGAVLAGMEQIVVAGGVNAGSLVPSLRQRDPATREFSNWMPPTHPDRPDAPNSDLSITMGWNAAQEMGLTRAEMDAWAYRSHRRAIAAGDAGHFVDEIVPVRVKNAAGAEYDFMVDEHPRRDSTMQQLASLNALHPEIEGFSITAGNSSAGNDAAAAMVVTTDEFAKEEGKNIFATILGWTSIGIDPARTGVSVPMAVEKLRQRTGFKPSDIKLWEINEAFASVPLHACRKMELDDETVNISGSGCSIGHSIGASGAQMIITLANDLRRRGGGLGIAALCAAGGQAGAVLIEVPPPA